MKTESGFSFTLDADEVRDDMELLENLTKLDKGDLTVLSDVLEGLLGTEQKMALYEHCRKNGRVRASLVTKELKSIFENLGDEKVKN